MTVSQRDYRARRSVIHIGCAVVRLKGVRYRKKWRIVAGGSGDNLRKNPALKLSRVLFEGELTLVGYPFTQNDFLIDVSTYNSDALRENLMFGKHAILY